MGFDSHTRGAYATVRVAFEICTKGRVSMSVTVYPCIKTSDMHLTFQELPVPGSIQNDLCFFPYSSAISRFFFLQATLSLYA